MASVENKMCSVCNEKKVHIHGVCTSCDAKAKEAKIKTWEKMSVEKKLKDINRRLLALEEVSIFPIGH